MSGKRFGGAYSPGGAVAGGAARSGARSDPFRGRRAARVDLRARLLFVLPTPLLISALLAIFGGDAMRTGLLLTGYAVLMGGAWLLGEGLKAEDAYDARAVARRPAIPRKILAAILAGIGVAIAKLASASGIVEVIGFAVLAGGAHLVAFGIDPLSNKGIDVGDYESGRVADALDKAEGMLAEIDGFAKKLRDREIGAKLAGLGASVRGMLEQIQADPRDLTRARRYLSVYLVGAHEATRKYTETHDKISDPTLRGDYIALITDLEESFARGHDKLLTDDRTDLEVEIEVLRDRLGQEKTG